MMTAIVMSSWISLLCLVLTCAYAWMWVSGRRARKLLAALPRYPTLPILGNIHLIIGNSEVMFRRLVEISQMAEEKMLPFVFWAGPTPVVLLSDPEEVKVVTNAFIEKPYFYTFGREWLGDGLVTAPGSVWRRNIKKLASTFTGSVVDGFQDVFNAQAQRLVENFKREVGGEPFDALSKYLANITLETICQTALGMPRMRGSIVTAEYYDAFNRSLELLIKRGVNLHLHPDFIYKWTANHKELMKCLAVIHNVSDMVIKKRKEVRDMRKSGVSEQTSLETGKIKFKAFLDILLDMSETDSTLTEEQIKSEVDTIIVGGQETVATTLLYSLLMIGCYPAVQEKLYIEIINIFGDTNRAAQKEDLARMVYCEALICETLRLYPPFPAVMRHADRDLDLKSCTIPKGTSCCINVYGAGRLKRVWGEDALTFRPERWLDGGPSHPAAFLAFSYGRRSCIGKKYGMALMKTILAYCVRELVFTSEAQKMRLKCDIVLRPISGHLMKVGLRKR